MFFHTTLRGEGGGGNVTITGQFGFVFEENSEEKSRDYLYRDVFENFRFQNVFRTH